MFIKADIPTLKYGRQLRLPDGAKLIIGRTEEENTKLEVIENPKYMHINTELFGPHCLISLSASEADKTLAAKLVLAYCKPDFEGEQALEFGSQTIMSVCDLGRNDAQQYFI